MNNFNSDIKKENYSVKSLLNEYAQSLKGLSNTTVEQLEAQALESMERGGIELVNAIVDLKNIYTIAELTQKYPPEDGNAYINANECLNYVIEDKEKHAGQMKKISETLKAIKAMVTEMNGIIEAVKPWER